MSKRQTARSAGPLSTVVHPNETKRARKAPALDRGRQLIRLFDVLRALEAASHGLSTKDLKEQLRLDCTERTIYRDLALLQQAGFGLIEEDHRYRLDRQHRLRAEPVPTAQVLALMLAEDFLFPLRGLEFAASLSSWIGSLRARLTPVGREFVDQARQSFAVTQRARPAANSPAALVVVQQGLEFEQRIELDYATPGKPLATRVVEPHLLWTNTDKPYLVAFCLRTNELRTFALARIQAARLLDDTFERRADFDPNAYVQRGFGVLHGPRHVVVVRFDAEIAHLAKERQWHASQRITTRPDRSTELQMTVEGLPEVAAWIAGFGGKVRAVAPTELIGLVRQIHESGLAAHGPKLASTRPAKANARAAGGR